MSRNKKDSRPIRGNRRYIPGKGLYPSLQERKNNARVKRKEKEILQRMTGDERLALANWILRFYDYESHLLSEDTVLEVDENCFGVPGEDLDTIKDEVELIALENKNCFICVRHLDSIIESPPLLKLLLKNDISVLKYQNRSESLIAIHLLTSFAEMNKEETENKVINSYLKKAVKKHKENADDLALELEQTIREIEMGGKTSLRAIANELTARDIASPGNKPQWNAMAVKRVKERIERLTKGS